MLSLKYSGHDDFLVHKTLQVIDTPLTMPPRQIGGPEDAVDLEPLSSSA